LRNRLTAPTPDSLSSPTRSAKAVARIICPGEAIPSRSYGKSRFCFLISAKIPIIPTIRFFCSYHHTIGRSSLTR
jgi:hypothetical protein